MDFNSVLFSIGDRLPKDPISTVILEEKFDRLSKDKQKEVVASFSVLGRDFLLGEFGVGRFMIGICAFRDYNYRYVFSG